MKLNEENSKKNTEEKIARQQKRMFITPEGYSENEIIEIKNDKNFN